MLTSASMGQAQQYPAEKASQAEAGVSAQAKVEDAMASPVSPTMQQVRRQILKSDGNAFYFREMKDLFFTREVPHASRPWVLPYVERPILATYQVDGKTLGLDDFLERTRTNAFLVIRNGKIVTEQYRNGTNAQTHFMCWSATKSIVSLLVGIAVSEGRIQSIDDPVTKYLPELKTGAYNGVSIRDILEMRSGVAYEERYDGAPGIASENHEEALIRNVRRFVEPALTIKQAHKPGAVFDYKTLDTAVLGWLVERVTDRPIAYYMAEKLWEPLGTEADGFFIMDGPTGSGREFTGAGYNATLRDLGRLGQMVLDKGKGNGRQIVPASWIAQATVPTNGEEGNEGGYGFQWWTVKDSNAFFALGLQGQFIYIDPDTRTVIVKTSYFQPDNPQLYAETIGYLGNVAKESFAP
ncbi:beta-lactamase family protein [Novosphingobium sp. 1949]|uniref:Beta-lactamase family protein n=1 Tax=Novosphingobium organovorum TaxID=2930092 RepID=A0ABT0BBF4_9SPHN|nr:serine hydrolase [Novosphingobium organovorum]MCJ2182146.1 beta-lactamase family protein [Novosphingobium organovorum]